MDMHACTCAPSVHAFVRGPEPRSAPSNSLFAAQFARHSVPSAVQGGTLELPAVGSIMGTTRRDQAVCAASSVCTLQMYLPVLSGIESGEVLRRYRELLQGATVDQLAFSGPPPDATPGQLARARAVPSCLERFRGVSASEVGKVRAWRLSQCVAAAPCTKAAL